MNQMAMSEFSPESQMQPLLSMHSKYLAKMAINAAKSPKSEALNTKLMSPSWPTVKGLSYSSRVTLFHACTRTMQPLNSIGCKHVVNSNQW